MPFGMIPQAVDKHIAAGIHSSPGELAGKVFDVPVFRFS